MEEDLLRRAADLAERCERTATVTSTAFLTPAEQYALTNWARHRDCTLVLHGGGAGCERRAADICVYTNHNIKVEELE